MRLVVCILNLLALLAVPSFAHLDFECMSLRRQVVRNTLISLSAVRKPLLWDLRYLQLPLQGHRSHERSPRAEHLHRPSHPRHRPSISEVDKPGILLLFQRHQQRATGTSHTTEYHPWRSTPELTRHAPVAHLLRQRPRSDQIQIRLWPLARSIPRLLPAL